MTDLLAVTQAVLIMLGWGLAQFPFVVYPDLKIVESAASAVVLEPVLITLALGMVLVVPSFWYLYAIFKGRDDSVKTSSD